MLKTSDLRFREGRVERVCAPHSNLDAGVGRERPATANDVISRLRRGSIRCRIPWSKASETLRVHKLVAVDQRGGDLLGHAFKERTDFGEAKFGGIPIQIGDILVDDSVRFEVADRIDNLSCRGLGVRDALVEQAPRGLRKACADSGFVSCWEIPFEDEHVFEDLVGLGEEFDDGCYSISIFNTLRPIGVG